MLAGVIIIIILYSWPEILRKLRGYQTPIGESYWSYDGDGAESYQNYKLEKVSPTPFGTYNVELEKGIVLPNVVFDLSSDDCNVEIQQTATSICGIVNIKCNIDARGKETEWSMTHRANYNELLRKARYESLVESKKQILESKEFKDTFAGESMSGAASLLATQRRYNDEQ